MIDFEDYPDLQNLAFAIIMGCSFLTLAVTLGIDWYQKRQAKKDVGLLEELEMWQDTEVWDEPL